MKLLDRKLFMCILADNIERAKYYIGKGANVNAVDARKNCGLMYVLSENMTRVLLENGANPNLRNLEGDVPLFVARNGGVANALLEGGANIKIKNSDGDSVLFKHIFRLKGAKPQLDDETFLEIWKVLKTFGIDALETNRDNKRARDYLQSDNSGEKRVFVRLMHYEAAQKIAEGAKKRAEQENAK